MHRKRSVDLVIVTSCGGSYAAGMMVVGLVGSCCKCMKVQGIPVD